MDNLVVYIFQSRCVANILRQIFLNFSPKEYESEILHVQVIHGDSFEDLQQLSPANDIVMTGDHLQYQVDCEVSNLKVHIKLLRFYHQNDCT